MNVHVDAAPKTTRIITYVVLGAIFLILLLIGLGTFRTVQRNQQAMGKAAELQAAYRTAGLPVPSTEQITGLLGTDGGRLCDDPVAFFHRTVTQYAATGAGNPGARPIITTDQFIEGTALAINVYCPEELAEFTSFVDDNYELRGK
ncbi:hypothetical protein [Luedemannella helvata]|uniref:DUF732 domain-containing protein n=1 Tax=Luedemannella helvata TaxID=349315 RepID=A0ABP4VT55_9ACTN